MRLKAETTLMRKVTTILGISATLGLSTIQADVFNGTLYYTNYTGGQNVNSVSYSYDQGTHALTLGAPTNIVSTPGADGIIFAPNGDLLVGGQGTGKVYDVNISSKTFTSVTPGTTGQDQSSYHLALDPSGTKFYTSDFGGPLDVVPLPFGTQGTTRSISGGDSGVTQIAFAPGTGKVFYVDGSPNGFGNVGTINLGTGVTTRLFAGIQPAHGLIFDPFTGLMTMFGAGETGTFDQNGLNLKMSGSLNGDFDQGAVDGSGHALIAGNGDITFLDYSMSHDITHPDFVIIKTGFGGIDDVAPLVGVGAPTPEPSFFYVVAGLTGLMYWFRKRAARKIDRTYSQAAML